jgi:hypothetical protein
VCEQFRRVGGRLGRERRSQICRAQLHRRVGDQRSSGDGTAFGAIARDDLTEAEALCCDRHGRGSGEGVDEPSVTPGGVRDLRLDQLEQQRDQPAFAADVGRRGVQGRVSSV